MIAVVDYDPRWPALFSQIRDHVWPHINDIAVGLPTSATNIAGT
jgi:hypothetical protein